MECFVIQATLQSYSSIVLNRCIRHVFELKLVSHWLLQIAFSFK